MVGIALNNEVRPEVWAKLVQFVPEVPDGGDGCADSAKVAIEIHLRESSKLSCSVIETLRCLGKSL
jgi:hypothetical protein